MWIVGSVLCDIIIAVCMTYYVGFLNFSLLSWEHSNLVVHYGSFLDMIQPLSELI